LRTGRCFLNDVESNQPDLHLGTLSGLGI
jgi:hypothetical protein